VPFGKERRDVTAQEIIDWYTIGPVAAKPAAVSAATAAWFAKLAAFGMPAQSAVPILGANLIVKYSVQPDGDYHLIDVKQKPPAPYVPYHLRTSASICGSAPPLPAGYIPLADWINVLRARPMRPDIDHGTGFASPALVGANESFFNDSPQRNAILSPNVERYLDRLRESAAQCPHSVPIGNHDLLRQAGIPVPASHSPDHPHPIHYALELQMLSFVKNLLVGINWYALFLNPSKASLFPTPPANFYNPRIVAKDINRFRGSFDPDSAPPGSDSPVWFAHDVLHHLTPSEVGSWFDRHPHLEVVFCTLVAPIEAGHRMSSMYPRLYNLRYRRDQVKYTPEFDAGGAYWQPADAYKWVQAAKIISPLGECLHSGVIHSRFAHHLIAISRSQLYGAASSPDIPDLVTVPRWVLPFSSLRARVTSPKLIQKLEDFSSSCEHTDWRDLYTKCRQFQMTDGQLYPTEYKFAAVTYVLALRAFRGHWQMSTLSGWALVASVITTTPLLPLKWLLASFVYSLSDRLEMTEPVFDPEPGLLVSSPREWTALSKPGRYCAIDRLPLHYVPPTSTRFERFWINLVAVQVFVVAKIVGVAILQISPHVVDWATSLWPHIQFRLGLTMKTPFQFGFCLIMAYWWNVSSAEGYAALSSLAEDFRYWSPLAFRSAWQLYWGLPSMALTRMRAGYGSLWRVFALYTWLTLIWPHLLYPLIPTLRIHKAWHILFVLYYLCAAGWSAVPFGRDLRPFHRGSGFYLPGVTYGGTDGSPPPTRPPSDDGGGGGGGDGASEMNALRAIRELLTSSSPKPSDLESSPLATPSPPPTFHAPAPVHRSQPGCFAAPPSPFSAYVQFARSGLPAGRPPNILPSDSHSDSDSGSDASSSSSSSSGGHPPPIPPAPAPPPQPPPRPANQNPRNFLVTPQHYPTAQLFRLVAANCPAPAFIPPAGRMCVWDCLYTLLHVDPLILMAIFDTHHPGILVAGAVPFEHLALVFQFYRVGVAVTNATVVNGVVTSALGAGPTMYGSVTPDWPTGGFALIHTPNDPCEYHLDPAIPVADNSGAVTIGPTRGDLVGLVSRFVSLSEMRLALNVPTRVFQRIYQSFNGNGVNPAEGPSNATTTLPVLPAPLLGLPPPVALPVIPLRAERIVYRSTLRDIADAQMLARDYKKYPQHLEIVDSNAQATATAIDAVAEHARPRDFDMVLWHGTAGTGKTTAFIAEIQALLAAGVATQAILVLAASDTLKTELMESIRPIIPALKSNNFATQGKVFITGASHIFFDDAGMFYPGFVQLVMCALPYVDCLYFSFDAAQGNRVFPAPTAGSRRLTHTAKWLSPMSATYATDVRRPSVENCRLFGFPEGAATTHGEVYICSQKPRDVPLLVASPRFAETKNNGGTQTFSFTDCQGLTFNGDVAIDLGGLSSSATDHAMFTALLRARGSVWLVMSPAAQNMSMLQDPSYGCSKIVSAMLAVAATEGTSVINEVSDYNEIVKRALQDHLASSLSPAAVALLGLPAPQPVVAGFSRQDDRAWEAVQAHRAIARNHAAAPRTYLPSLTPFEVRPYAPQLRHSHRKDFAKHAVRHYLPIASDTRVSASPTAYVPPHRRTQRVLVDPVDAFDRLPRSADDEAVASDFIEPTAVRDPLGPREAQHHRGTDQALFQKSIPDRCPPRRDDPELTAADRLRLNQLIGGFRKSVDIGPERCDINELLLEDCLVRCAESWFAGKSKAQIQAAVGKWEVDDDPLFIRVFQKGQWIKKLEARGADVKKSQVIAQVAMSRTFRDAVWCEYLEASLLPKLRPHTLYFNRLNPAQLGDWFTEHWDNSQPVTANDYTGWDTGVDRVFLAFDIWLMEHFGFPPGYVARYRRERYLSRTFVGPYPIMQPSGDRYTLLLNSMRNLALCGASLDFLPGTPIAVCGDDSVVCGAFKKPRYFQPRAWRMTPKLSVSPVATFCGWSIGSTGFHISLESLTYRARIGLQRGIALPDFWRSVCEMVPLTHGSEWEYSALKLVLDTAARDLCPIPLYPF
jgi:hypothetical protein